MALGSAGGALLGLVASVTSLVLGGQGVADAWSAVTAGLTVVGDPTFLLVVGGAVGGWLIALAFFGWEGIDSAFHLATGAVLGGVAGLVIYSVAYVLVGYPDVPAQTADVFRFAQAVYSFTPIELIFVALAAAAGAFLSRYSWRLYGVLTFVSLLFVILGYILYTLLATLPQVPPADRAVSTALFAAELTSLSMVLLYSFYTIDVVARKRWRRTVDEAPFSAYYLPKVAFHVPTYNEPPDLVLASLATLLALDYPKERLVIMVGDDSTRRESSQPLKAYCEAHGIAYHHRRDRRGYKAGALNGLLAATPADANLIAVIDADYQVEPSFLKETVGYFIDPDLAFLQTPQDYRNRSESFLTEQYYLADAYFYRTILPSRNEENSIIFCGTMGVLRRRALEQVGGWGERHITEDAELSVRLLGAGWRSLYINRTYGHGLIPATFEAYKGQHYRWAFGGGRIMRSHGLRFLFGRYTFRQRLDYLVGALNWFEGLFVLAIALFVLAMGIGDIQGQPVTTHHTHEIFLVGLVPLFLLLDGLTRVHLVLRRSVSLSFGGTIRILGMWSSVKFSNMRAALKGLVGFTMPFVRTAKRPEQAVGRLRAAGLAIRLTRFESFMSLSLAATLVGVVLHASGSGGIGNASRLLLVLWLAYYALVFMAAPLYAYKSFATIRPGRPVGDSRTTDVPA
ncbi:MAG: glycosyltransferase [Thermoplasmatota archaeon]